jgi:cellulose biosynthesis protein BcsQ
VRKILVASQKCGVGKTTTSMNLAAAAAAQTGTRVLLLDADPLSNISTALNLAEHPLRRTLRQSDIDLPGVLVPNLVPGLDVLSPYEGGHCSDEDFERLLRALATPAMRPCYGSLIVDVPPFMGGNAAQLLGSCDEFLLVMRAEAMAYRTLPAFLELVQRSSREDNPVPMRGILLTLPEGEQPGCRWERELRGRFGTRVLPEVIPHDELIEAALRTGQIGSHLHADSPAALQYHQLVGKLGLSDEASSMVEIEPILQTLREAAVAIGPVIAPAPAVVAPSVPIVVAPPIPAKKSSAKVPRFEPESTPIEPSNATVPRPRRLSHSGESLRPGRPERPLPPPAAASVPVRIKVVPAKADSAENPVVAPVQPSANALAQLWPLWILLGAVLGGGLRFIPLHDSMLPILVGLGVALIVVVGMFALAAQGRSALSAPTGKSNRQRSREVKKTPKPNPSKGSVSARLAALANTSKRRQRDPDAN